MNRTSVLSFASVVSVAMLAGARPAHAFTPLQFREVPELRGKQVYVAASVELDRASATWVFAGEPVTLRACDKTTTTINHPGHAITGWLYARCTITTADKHTGSIGFDKLSRTPLKFDLREPGTLAALRRAAFDEAFDTVLAMVAYEKTHEAELSPDRVTGNVDGADVIGEYAEQWRAMADAWEMAARLHTELVNGTHYTLDSAMREPRNAWMVHAKDQSILTAWTKGAEDRGERKRLAAGADCLTKLHGVRTWGMTPYIIADQLAAKEWRHGIHDASEQQLAALDKDNVTKLEKQLASSRAAFRKALDQAQAIRKRLSW